jgi:hypothetical protein
MTTTKIEFNLTKSESKILKTLNSYGGQIKKDLILISEIQADKAEEAITKLLEKGFISFEDTSEMIFLTLPISALTSMITSNISEIERKKEEQNHFFQLSKESVNSQLSTFEEQTQNNLEQLQKYNQNLEDSVQEALKRKDKNQHSQLNEIIDDLVTSVNSRIVESENASQEILSDGLTNLEKHWNRGIDGFQNLPESGTRNLRESIVKYEAELETAIKSSVDQIKKIQAHFMDLLTSVEAESTQRIQEFFTNSNIVSNDLKTNLNTGLLESRKKGKEFIEEVQEHVRISLEKDVLNTLKKVVADLTKDIDKEINTALVQVKKQTDSVIDTSSVQLQTEFKEFAESAKELILEQKSSLNVLDSAIIEESAEQKLKSLNDLFLNQVKVDLSSEINQIETSYRLAQNSVMDIMETLRKSAKTKLVQQSVEFEKLITSFSGLIDHSLTRKDLDISRFQQLSQSVEHLLRNLSVSIPMRTNQYRESLKETFEHTSTTLQDEVNDFSQSSIKKIYDSLSKSQEQISTITNETLEESKKEIQKVITSSDQFQTEMTSLQDEYLEKVENRFDQRAKVMNTELEAISRNFQQLLEGIEYGIGDLQTRLSSDTATNLSSIETTLQSKLTQLQNEITTLFAQNQSETQNFVQSLESNFQTHLDRTLEVVKEGFSQVKEEFGLELSKQLEDVNDQNKNHQESLVNTLEDFIKQMTFTEFKGNLEKTLEENKGNLNDCISENRSGLDEVLSLQKDNIAKYQERGPTDILSFINQIQTSATAQNRNIKETMEELLSFYDSFADSTIIEVNSIVRQVHESGDKIKSLLNESLQAILNNINRTSESLDLFYSDTLTELENQLGVASGFVTSEIETSTDSIQGEISSLKSKMDKTISNLNSEIKEVVSDSDQEFKNKLPDISKEFDRVFNNLVEEKTALNHETQKKISENIETFIESYTTQVGVIRTKIHDLLAEFNKAIDSNIDNLDVIVENNIQQTIKSMSSIYQLDAAKDDPFGLKDIQSKISTANKRLKAVVSESLRNQIEEFEKKIPNLTNSFEAIQDQSEEDLTKSIEEFSDLVSSSQLTISTQLHNYLNEEKELLDFTEYRNNLKDTLHGFTKDSTQNIEQFAEDFADSIQRTVNEVNKSRDEIQTILTNMTQTLTEKNKETLEEYSTFKSSLISKIEGISTEANRDVSGEIGSYKNEIDKFTLETKGNMAQFIQNLKSEVETSLNERLSKTQETLDHLIDEQTAQSTILNTVESEILSETPIPYLRLLKLSTNNAINEYILDLIKNSSKQLTIYISDPTILSPVDLKAVPSNKRIWIFTSFDFTKKGKKWFSEIGNQVNINIRSSKGSKITGILAVQDEVQALVLPEDLGFITADTKFVSYLVNLLNMLKGTSIRLKN